MRKASRIYKRKSRSNLETFIILIGAIIILGVAFNLARDRSYIPPEEPAIIEEGKVESPLVVREPEILPQKEAEEKFEEKEKSLEEEITKEIISEEKPPVTVPSLNTATKIEPEVEVVKESKLTSDQKVYTVQVGAFSQEINARNLAEEIRVKGYQTYVVKGKSLYKTQVGEYKSYEEAQNVSQKLKQLGYPIFVTSR
ncbi:MAG TPA: SPOR domain-containing protein [Candidatus Atribacteria bacterium]|nr:SPOR domain-containing protein [Candidatus Atribacteria bacterium]